MEEISNSLFSLSVSPKGAEMQSLKRLSDGREYLWQADPAFWDRHSPVLFPIVGGLWQGVAHFDGHPYAIPRHGFVRDRHFDVVERSAERLVMACTDTPDEYAVFPFHYRLEVVYAWHGQQLEVTFRVHDADDRPMWFQIGGHPGFALPDFRADEAVHAYARLEGNVERLLHTGEQCCLVPGHFAPPALEADGLLALKDDTTAPAGLIFDGNQVKGVELLDKERRPFLRLRSNAPATLLWAETGAPFICIEPWYGLCDYRDFEGDFSQRPYANCAAPGQTWTGGYVVDIL